jgi:hypothetical protein
MSAYLETPPGPSSEPNEGGGNAQASISRDGPCGLSKARQAPAGGGSAGAED